MTEALPKLNVNQRETLRLIADSLDRGSAPRVSHNPRGQSLKRLGVLVAVKTRHGLGWGITELGIQVLDDIGRVER
jgi:hypothetical protein